MEGEEGGGIRLSKRFSDKGGEVDNKTKSGTAWSHSYLNQKPWHPLSYPNQRRKWIAEQIQAQHQRRSEEYAQEQEFFRQAALISKKDKEKIENMKAVSFMYVRPPGYNAESAKAAELADESMRDGQQTQTDGPSTSMPPSGEEGKKKPRPKDVFGRSLPTEQEFEVLKNAPRLETGVPTRAKPFGVEVRNVKCVRCGTFGHQSGDRECPLKDVIMPNEESRLKRDDPLTAILAHTDPSEPLKWELKQKPGISPPRGGFRPDDPNQQIVAEEDIFDEYGGFLSGDVIPELLANFSSKPKKKSKKNTKRKTKRSPSISGEDQSSSDEDDKRGSKKKVSKLKKKKRNHSESSSPEIDRHKVKNKYEESYSSEDLNHEKHHRSSKNRPKHSQSFEDSDMDRWQYRRDKNRDRDANSSEDSEPGKNQRGTRLRSEDSDGEKHHRSTKNRQRHSHSYKDFEINRHFRREKSRDSCANSFEDSEPDRHLPSDQRRHQSRHRHSYLSEDSEPDRHHSSDKRRQWSRHRHSYLSEDTDIGRQKRSKRSRDELTYSFNETDDKRHRTSRNSRHKH
ncbi:putative transcription factor interactor and regulator CCHC(Zn) family [Rosa chinensis]|uniref:Putative transcription factor interactor and regulator CCHC(Zn) family n=1 Tax=Rosa chinensis TaxID=74649 RepID=A0A2P6PZK5_ROSCH|nr:putative transcription factor interactor and regulator CCHC(Zn) family [Rosa chinensis]